MSYEPITHSAGDVIRSSDANYWQTQFDQSVKYSEINRQTVIQGAVSSLDGTANFITGSTSALTAFATASTSDPLIISFANGNSTLGGLNYDISLTSDSSWTGLNASNTNYLFFETSTASAVTSSHTIVPPQYGYFLDTTQNCLLHFDGTAGSTVTTDNFGNTWTNFGTAALSTAQIKFGTASLTLPGSSNSYIETTNITSLGLDGWTLEGQFYINSTATHRAIVSSVNGYGFTVYYDSITGHLTLYLAGSTIAWSIANGSSGTTTINSSSWTKWSLGYNSSSYTLHVNGLSDITVTSTVPVNSVLGGIRIGLDGTETFPFSGYIDEFRYTKNTKRYLAAYTPESSALTGDVHFFDINKMKMYFGDPTSWVEKIRVFVGEAVTSATEVTSAITYALKGKSEITSSALSTSQIQTFTHKMGFVPNLKSVLLNTYNNIGYFPGDEIECGPNYVDDVNDCTYTISANKSSVVSVIGTVAIVLNNKLTATATALNLDNWFFKFYLSRKW